LGAESGPLPGPAVRGARAATVEEIVRLPSEGDAVLPDLPSHDDARSPRAGAVLFTA